VRACVRLCFIVSKCVCRRRDFASCTEGIHVESQNGHMRFLGILRSIEPTFRGILSVPFARVKQYLYRRWQQTITKFDCGSRCCDVM